MSLLITFVGLNSLLASLGKITAFNANAPVVRPPGKVSIIVPVWNEPEEFVMAALQSLHNQNIVRAYPYLFEFIIVDGVPYVNKLRKYGKVIHAPPGKLVARDKAIRTATGDIIVSVDADCIYPVNWLNQVLAPFHDAGVVGVSTTSRWLGPLEVVFHIPKRIFYSNVMSGRGSAFRRDAYFKIGGFNTKRKYLSIDELQLEEEVGFMQRLKQVGKVVLVDAPVIHLGGVKMEGRGLRSHNPGEGF